MIQFNEFYLLQYFKKENRNKVIRMVIEEKIIHILGFLVNKQIYQYIYNFINHETSPLPSPATYPPDTTFQCFCLFIFPSLIQSSQYTSLKTLQTYYKVQMQAFKNQEECFFIHPNPWLNSFFYFFFSSQIIQQQILSFMFDH